MQTYVHSILNKLIRPECRREENTRANVSMQCDAIPSTLMLAADSRHNGVTHANEIYFFSFIFTAILIYLFLCLVLCLLFLHRIFFFFRYFSRSQAPAKWCTSYRHCLLISLPLPSDICIYMRVRTDSFNNFRDATRLPANASKIIYELKVKW